MNKIALPICLLLCSCSSFDKHSERRKQFDETQDKIDQSLQHIDKMTCDIEWQNYEIGYQLGYLGGILDGSEFVKCVYNSKAKSTEKIEQECMPVFNAHSEKNVDVRKLDPSTLEDPKFQRIYKLHKGK